jgi:RimJ/RimL family protein N-acetyltransferase
MVLYLVSILKLVISAKAGIHLGSMNMDSRVRGNDERISKAQFQDRHYLARAATCIPSSGPISFTDSPPTDIVIAPVDVSLEGHGVRLEPLSPDHETALAAAVQDGELFKLWYTAVPEPRHVDRYISDALAGRAAGTMLPWAVRELATGDIAGSTRYHDIVAPIDRVEIGYTWYAARWQRSHVNTATKLLLLTHAFETLGCAVVGFRTDNFNLRSQRAIEALGAKRDGVLRHHQARRDGTARDTYLYSILAAEWPDVKRHLTHRLHRGGGGRATGS